MFQNNFMTIKITDQNIDQLKHGDFVMKYPIFGDLVNEVDFEDKERMIVLMVGVINDETIDLLATIPENSTLAGMKVFMSPLHKNKNRMIEDNCWWLISN